MVPSEIAMYGWIAGSACMTLPMSVEPTRSSSRASNTCMPSERMCSVQRSANGVENTMLS